MGSTLKELGYEPGLAPESGFVAVKAPVFSFSKLTTVDTFLGPEMKSTGEVMGVDKSYLPALYKAFLASGMAIPSEGRVLISVADRDKKECVEISRRLSRLGFDIAATDKTYEYLKGEGMKVEHIPAGEVLEYIKSDKLSLVINTPTRGKIPSRLGFMIRRTAIEFNVPCITSLDTTKAALEVLEYINGKNDIKIYALDEYSRRSTKELF